MANNCVAIENASLTLSCISFLCYYWWCIDECCEQVTAEVVGTGSDGTEPSLLFSVQCHGLYSDDVKVLKTYLFNCGEGTQRLAGENGIKLRSLDAMYFTRFDVKSVSGVPGVIFALGSCGAATLGLHGPVGLRGFLGGIQSFVRRKYPQIQCVEIAGLDRKIERDADNAESFDYETWRDGAERKDQHAMIIPIELRGNAEMSSDPGYPPRCLLCDKNAPKMQVQPSAAEAMSSSTPTDTNQSSNKARGNQIGRRRENESDEHERWRAWILRYYTEKVPAKIPYIDAVLNRYRGRYDDLKAQLCAKYGDISDGKSLPSLDAKRASTSSDSSSDSDNDDGDDTAFDYTERQVDRRWLEKFYAEYQPEKLAHIDKVLRQYSGREDTLKQMLLKKYGRTVATTTHSGAGEEGVPRKKRKLLEPSEDHCKTQSDDQIPKLYTSKDNTDEMRPSYVSCSLCYILQFQYDPYPVVWIIDCQAADHIADLENKFSATTNASHESSCDSHSPSFVVHLSPAHVQVQPRYKQWMTNLSRLKLRPEQLIFDGGALQRVLQGAFSYAFNSSAKSAVRRELQAQATTEKTESSSRQKATTAIEDLANFLEGESWSAESPCRRQVVQRMEGSEIDVHVAQSKLQFRLMHPKEVQLGFNYERTGWHQKADKDQEDDEGENGGESEDQQLSDVPLPSVDVSALRKLIVLGTGSAAPSKLRASSGMFLELSGTKAGDVDSMLVDCGEGTFGQLWRQFGGDVAARIGGLRCVWISHNHADHHCGLVRVLYEYWHFHTHRKSGKAPRDLVVIAPQSVLSYVENWFPQILRNDSDQQLIKLATCSDFNDVRHPLRCRLLSEIGYAVTSITSVRVFHCYDSYGLVLTLRGGKKLVYSGDTKPCNDLVLAGMDAELLVHEATFDDSMEMDATMKKHSTVGQALDIARRMRARQVLLTHFSQRYPSLPPPVTETSEGSGSIAAKVMCAYDGFVHPMPF